MAGRSDVAGTPFHQKIKELAEHRATSVNQFIASAAVEKMSSVMTLDPLQSEVAKGKRSDFENHLGRVPDVPAQPWIRMHGKRGALARRLAHARLWKNSR